MLGFGGPAAHIAMFRDEAVHRRRWLTDQHFADLVGATSLIPGPNSTEMAIHLGLERAGWRGLVAAGALFILPAFLIVTGLAWVYVEFNEVPALQGALYGIKPAVLAIVIHAIVGLGRTALRTRWTQALAAGVLALSLLGINVLILLAAGGVAGLLRAARPRLGPPGRALLAFLPAGAVPGVVLATPAFGLGQMFLLFLKVGAVLYGSGYVLLAFLQGDFVDDLGWLTQQQLLDAVAVGQMTPGPVFTTASFVGYLLGGWPGAVLATVGIFLPSFVFVAMLHSLLARARAAPQARALPRQHQRRRARADDRRSGHAGTRRDCGCPHGADRRHSAGTGPTLPRRGHVARPGRRGRGSASQRSHPLGDAAALVMCHGNVGRRDDLARASAPWPHTVRQALSV